MGVVETILHLLAKFICHDDVILIYFVETGKIDPGSF